jgi:catechol 2,3-dioxygenase-like lactoylglutathione lyase family enzyme
MHRSFHADRDTPNVVDMRLAHLGITVTDQQRSQRFYETHFGFDPDTAQTYPDGTVIIRDKDGFALALRSGAPQSDEFLHFGSVCTSPAEARQARERLIAAGMGLVEDDDTESYVGIKVLEPDGYRIEVSCDL